MRAIPSPFRAEITLIGLSEFLEPLLLTLTYVMVVAVLLFVLSGTVEIAEKLALERRVICLRMEQQAERRETRENYRWMLNLPSIQL
jgi:hypothetical protein